jgi:hypothetical protein
LPGPTPGEGLLPFEVPVVPFVPEALPDGPEFVLDVDVAKPDPNVEASMDVAIAAMMNGLICISFYTVVHPATLIEVDWIPIEMATFNSFPTILTDLRIPSA